ncbi:MAG: fasciclin domain-containing protein [Brevundimonas sp.]|uniref:fasciclin domain-containing protein n=1 Tax=Brevundimonas sp. TaxID=1871086 RepID=UPI0027244D85|nr:fasciclin domain-containing protein [Brevundimonas sp.]MDO9076443.1 fasciclin domain-containing protein [Brevundimonas sp.]MDP3081821.1 fasciclin domain-containing protein [Brevundimonas sp.]MDZ4059671.1 fasciclin domain-containing protein [Brevundimonas sp.]
MKFTRTATLAGVSIAALLALAACNNAEQAAPADAAATDASAMAPAPAATGTVVAVAQGNADFSTLVSAVTAADLAGTLGGAGPFTVFAPTNAAFEKVPAATRETLMSPAGKADLTKILTYHVVPGRVDAATLTQQIQAGGGSAALTTVEGGVLTARVGADGSVTLTDENGGVSRVVQADVAASNGVIHAIDTVVMPN